MYLLSSVGFTPYGLLSLARGGEEACLARYPVPTSVPSSPGVWRIAFGGRSASAPTACLPAAAAAAAAAFAFSTALRCPRVPPTGPLARRPPAAHPSPTDQPTNQRSGTAPRPDDADADADRTLLPLIPSRVLR